ncbi:hypothetical protein [Salinibacterium sp. ZJ454]|uniref:hypothetical protein n=1 Tax=Salinibacterium sp. ZJ454 TaxID=2708339 RepID=UPI0014240F39|nr:hypothetical protein [Salinibacterium sp. ZJ454]
MTGSNRAAADRDGQLRYEIRLDGHLDERWAEWFEGLSITRDGDGTTALSGPVTDQAALHGLLGRVRDLGMTLVSVNVIGGGGEGEGGGCGGAAR